MNILLIVMTVILMSLQSVFQKQYNLKTKTPNAFLFSSATALFAMVFFVISAGFKLDFSLAVLPYSIGFAVAYAAANVSMILAVRCGSLAITNLILAYSLIIPTLYGIVFLKDDIGVNTYFGIALLLISLLLLNAKDGEENTKFSIKWLVFAILAFAGNGMCSTVQKMQQSAFDGSFKSEFMIVALAIVVVIMLVAAFMKKGVRSELKGCAKYAVPCGLANGGVNLLVMILTGMVASAILFPTISAGGIVLSFIISVFFYKEKLSKMQMAGYAIGIISVILLNL